MSAATPPASPPAPAPIGESCPLCGAPLGAEQEWCLQCGAAARTRLAATPKWRTPVIALSAVIVLSLGALTAALISLAGDSGTSVAGTVSVTTTTPAAALGAAGAASTPTATVPGAATAGQDAPTVAAPGASTRTGSAKSAPSETLPSERGGAHSTAGVPAAGTGTGSGARGGAGSATSTPAAGTPATTPTSTAPAGAQAHKGKAMEKLLHAIERHGGQSQRQAAGAPAG